MMFKFKNNPGHYWVIAEKGEEPVVAWWGGLNGHWSFIGEREHRQIVEAIIDRVLTPDEVEEAKLEARDYGFNEGVCSAEGDE